MQQRQTIVARALILLCALLATAGSLAKSKHKEGDEPKKEAPKQEQKEADEPQLGDAAESAYLTYDYIFVDAPQIEAYLTELMTRLLAAKNADVETPDVLIRSSDAFDIFTDASRNVVVSTALLREMSSEDELVAALGHELSHQILKHPQRKGALRAFPMGFETVTMIKTAASESVGAKPVAYTGSLDKLGKESLSNTQSVNLIWNDLLSPSWNRKQERAADESGLDLARDAGYDAGAFGALFQKLHAAEGKRTERMEILKKVMLARAKAAEDKQKLTQKTTADAADNAFAKEAKEMAGGLKDTMTESAAEAVIEGLASFNREYDPPDERQRLLAEYAREHRQKQLPAKPTSRFKEVLKSGAGAKLLTADLAAVKTMNALTAQNTADADKFIKTVLPAKQGGPVLAPHLNFAVGTWHHLRGRSQLGEQYAKAWLAAKRPPAQAYVWVAYYQAGRNEFTGAIATMEQGRERVGNSAPFLPHLVSLARAAGQNEKAEEYAMGCKKEDDKNTANAVVNMVRGQQLPSGLYADCVQRLGHEPAAAKEENAALEAVKHPVEATKGFTQKLRDKFKKTK